MQPAQKVLILSGDKDFIQLQKYSNVKQYDPTRKKWISHENPDMFLKEHILRGDASDGVPNILSPDNCFVIGERQKSLTAKKLKDFIEKSPEEYDSFYKKNYFRNSQLIDLQFTPEDLKSKIMDIYNLKNENNRSKLLNYFIANKLKNLMENIGEF